MIEVPFATPVMSPAWLIVANAGLLLLQVTFWLEAVLGTVVATAWKVLPTLTVVRDGFRVTPWTGVVTVTATVAVKPMSCVVAIIIALPLPLPVIVPLEFTVTINGLLVVQITVLFPALLGLTVATTVLF